MCLRRVPIHDRDLCGTKLFDQKGHFINRVPKERPTRGPRLWSFDFSLSLYGAVFFFKGNTLCWLVILFIDSDI